MYTTKLLVENYLQRSLTENEEAFLAVANPAVKRYIDRKTNSTFDKADPSARLYEACEQNLDIDKCTDVESVTVLDPYGVAYYSYQPFEYVVEPVNEPLKNEIRLRYGEFPEGTANIQVVAKFSEWVGGVPEDIQTVATRLIGALINDGKYAKTGGNITSETLEGHSVGYGNGTGTASPISAFADNDPHIQAILSTRNEPLIW